LALRAVFRVAAATVLMESPHILARLADPNSTTVTSPCQPDWTVSLATA
jgi:hypothetical protein